MYHPTALPYTTPLPHPEPPHLFCLYHPRIHPITLHFPSLYHKTRHRIPPFFLTLYHPSFSPYTNLRPPQITPHFHSLYHPLPQTTPSNYLPYTSQLSTLYHPPPHPIPPTMKLIFDPPSTSNNSGSHRPVSFPLRSTPNLNSLPETPVSTLYIVM